MTPGPQNWQRVEDLFLHAVELPFAERAAWLAGQCGEDHELRRQVEAMLAADHSAGAKLNAAVGPAAGSISQLTTVSDAGRRIGPYVLVREIGRGGMGAVYQAIRADGEFHQTVAVKLIRRGLASEQILRRFRQERHILARLDHPNIARLLDAGTGEDGQPYLVMDYVDGVPFTRYCRERQLDQAGKLRLFLEICAGVQHAHQKLVVHRDLKPANILVTSDGRPKLLDFGIAKWLDPDIAPETVIETATGVRVLTPDYASPEQLRGEAVTVRSDIFALGAILHELLSGEKAVSSHSTLAGEEGAIVRRAMRTDPSERYPSVDALAADVRLCLEANSRARPMPVSRRLAAAAILILCAASALWFLRKPAPLRLDSVAVLPFVNLGVESTGDVFSDGVTEDLITELTAIAGLKVSSRTAVWQYKGKAFDPRQAGRAMGVSAVLEGSVRRSGDQIRIVTQLISVDDGFHLWARSYDRKAGDLL
ncbi:MAG: serine/threonine-protein kinase, partial [Bryobacteraceae bacterium]|nr:serine/threonine-protein kinase [Bryobacteraceae bacterium]